MQSNISTQSLHREWIRKDWKIETNVYGEKAAV